VEGLGLSFRPKGAFPTVGKRVSFALRDWNEPE
jgi:hypothetical protein